MLGDQRIDHFAERDPFHDLRQLVERQVDAMIGDARLRKIIGTDALGAIAGADLAFAFCRARGIEPLPLHVARNRAAAAPCRRAWF